MVEQNQNDNPNPNEKPSYEELEATLQAANAKIADYKFRLDQITLRVYMMGTIVVAAAAGSLYNLLFV